MRIVCRIAMLTALAGVAVCQIAAGQQGSAQGSAQPSGAASSGNSTASKVPAQTAGAKPSGPMAMTNRDVIQLVKAKIPDDVIIAKINKSKTKFDISTQGQQVSFLPPE